MTSTEARASRSERLSPRNWSLAWKLVAVGLVPALLAIVLGVLRVADQARTASELGAANRLLEVREQVAGAAAALRIERDRATLFVAERRSGDRGPLTDAVRGTDAAVEQVRTGVAAAGDLDAATRAAVEQAEGGFAQLSVLRTEVGGSAPLDPSRVVQRYGAIVDRADVLDRALLRQVRTPEVAGLTDALTAVTSASEAVALQHTVLGAALRTGTVSPADRAVVNATDNALLAAYTEYQVALPPSQTPINFITSAENARRDAEKATILSAPAPAPAPAAIPVPAAGWDEATQQTAARIDAAGAEVRTALAEKGAAAESRSSNLAGINSVILMLGLLLAVTVIVMVARALTHSLRVLRSSALDVAERRLPQAVESMRSGGAPDVTVEPVPLHSRDEVGQVARAFDAVHGQALRLAADQAALQANVSSMFVNLSRRSQALVERQLQLIERLESNEQDPDQLSNLFQLDHLATRMRRNSENLLVLAGTDLAKRNVAPVPLVDVLRAAVSEIEQYQRIVVQAPPQATIIGRAASDIVHLLAELLDNATNFSPPESQVVMSSMRAPDGSITVEIADHGVGMLEHELGDANRRLRTPSAVDVSASRRMGLFVVGRLGARHGITVHLGGAPMGGPGGGLTASVTLPGHLVVSAGDLGVRPPRSDAAIAPPNGVPPQRAGRLDRPLPRSLAPAPLTAAPLATGAPTTEPGDAAQPTAGPQARERSVPGVNGLPTRTPGSALRRLPASGPAPTDADAADPVTTEQPITVVDDAPVPAPGRVNGGAVEPVPGAGPEAAVNGSSTAADEATDAGTAEADPVPTGSRSVATHTDAEPAAPPAPAQDGSAADDRAPAGSTAAGRAGSTAAGRAESTAADSASAAADGRVEPVAGAAGDRTPEPSTESADAGKDRLAGAAEAEVAGREVTAHDTTRSGGGQVGTVDRAPDGAPAAAPLMEGGAGPEGAPASARPRPRPGPRPNGAYRDVTARSVPFGVAAAAGAGVDGSRNGNEHNGVEHNGVEHTAVEHPPTTPLSVVPGPGAAGPESDGTGPDATGPETTGPETTGPATPDPGADALFAPSVPAPGEPDGPEGFPRSRLPLAALRRGPVDPEETTPIFAAIASAWFASDRPVPVDWELGRRPGAELDPESPVQMPASSALTGRGPLDPPDPAQEAPVPDPGAARFASVADEGWRAANGAATERPDELTAAGLPKRRPRARLVPGSAGSAVLAAPVPPTRSAESIRGRLASYQQGVRQGREIRLRRAPGGAGTRSAAPEQDTAAPAGGEHDEAHR